MCYGLQLTHIDFAGNIRKSAFVTDVNFPKLNSQLGRVVRFELVFTVSPCAHMTDNFVKQQLLAVSNSEPDRRFNTSRS
jgi:hypothetical protein